MQPGREVIASTKMNEGVMQYILVVLFGFGVILSRADLSQDNAVLEMESCNCADASMVENHIECLFVVGIDMLLEEGRWCVLITSLYVWPCNINPSNNVVPPSEKDNYFRQHLILDSNCCLKTSGTKNNVELRIFGSIHTLWS